MCSDGVFIVTCAGSPFQTRAAEIGKARSPTVQRHVSETMSASDNDERSRCLDSRSATSLSRRLGTMVPGRADNDRRAWPACTQCAEVQEANASPGAAV